MGNGEATRFLEDTWLGDKPLSWQYPSLYSIVHRKGVSVADVLTNAPPPNLSFRRVLTVDRWDRWLHLVHRLMHVHLTNHKDRFKWGLTRSGLFTVKSLYIDFMSGHTRFLRKYIWKMKVPLKIRIFMWFLYRKEILTKDNLVRRRWNGCKKCCFCDQEKTIQHLLLIAPLLKWFGALSIWLLTLTHQTTYFGNWLRGVSKVERVQI